MHLDGLGDIRQHHRFHILFTLLKERLLLFDNTAAYAEQRIISALQTFDQPSRFLQIATNVLIIGVVTHAGAHGGILLVDLQARDAVRVQFNDPAVIVFSDQHIRDDVLGFAGLNGLTGARIEGLNQIDRLFQHLFFQARDAHQAAEIVIGQKIQMVADDQAGFIKPWRLFAELRKLDKQAVAQIFCGHPNRIETLNALQNGFYLLEFNLFVTHAFQNFVQRDGQITGVIHGIDNGCRDRAVGIGEGGKFHLPHQVILQ